MSPSGAIARSARVGLIAVFHLASPVRVHADDAPCQSSSCRSPIHQRRPSSAPPGPPSRHRRARWLLHTKQTGRELPAAMGSPGAPSAAAGQVGSGASPVVQPRECSERHVLPPTQREVALPGRRQAQMSTAVRMSSPEGRRPGRGGCPSIPARASARSGEGTVASSARVYGWIGLVDSRVAPSSTSRPAYTTATRDTRPPTTVRSWLT